MSLISFPFDITSATKQSGTIGTYTCPPNKKAIISIFLSNTVLKSAVSPNTPGINSNSRTFLDFADTGDTFTFVSSGNGAHASGSISASYLKNLITQQTITTVNTAGSGVVYYYSSEASYSVIEYDA